MDKPTKDQCEFFIDRTAKHISLVEKYAKLIGKKHPDINDELLRNVIDHDSSKYCSDEELIPYIFLTDFHRYKGDKDKMDDELKELTDKACLHHLEVNPHHPEYFKPEDYERGEKFTPDGMGKIDIAEMCADWLAMGEELGNSAIDWYDSVKETKYDFTDEQDKLIKEMLNVA